MIPRDPIRLSPPARRLSAAEQGEGREQFVEENRDTLARYRGPDLVPPPAPARILTSPLALTPGTRLGPYEIAAQIGVGGMGEVYRATDTTLNRQVAVKVLPE